MYVYLIDTPSREVNVLVRGYLSRISYLDVLHLYKMSFPSHECCFWLLGAQKMFLAIYSYVKKKVLMKKAVSTQFLTSTVNLSRIFDLFHNSWHSLSNIVKKKGKCQKHTTQRQKLECLNGELEKDVVFFV